MNQQLNSYSTNIWLAVQADIEQEYMNNDDSNLKLAIDKIGLYKDVLEYISGYIIKRLKLSEYEEKDDPSVGSFLSYVNQGGLKIPKRSFNDTMVQLENIFTKSINNIIYKNDVIQELCYLSQGIDIDCTIKELFFKVRLFSRLKHLNRRLARIKKIKWKDGNKLYKMAN